MASSLFQTPEWAGFKCQTGWSKQYWLDGILVLEKRLPLGRTMYYSPLVSKYQISNIKYQNFNSKLKSLATESNTIFYRLEIDAPQSDTLKSKIQNLDSRFAKSFEEMQPEHTLILDITRNEEEILAQMKPKGRYNIKVAERSSLSISDSDKPGRELDDFYALYEAMAKRQKISYRSKKYFEALLEILGQKGYARVYTARIPQKHLGGVSTPSTSEVSEPLAAAIVAYYNNEATYLFGGSSDLNRNLMAPYLLHWQVIKDAKARGCTEYNLFGIAPNDDPKHPWGGVTRFKKQFGGHEVHLAGSWDLVFRPLEYQVFKFVEKIRR